MSATHFFQIFMGIAGGRRRCGFFSPPSDVDKRYLYGSAFGWEPFNTFWGSMAGWKRLCNKIPSCCQQEELRYQHLTLHAKMQKPRGNQKHRAGRDTIKLLRALRGPFADRGAGVQIPGWLAGSFGRAWYRRVWDIFRWTQEFSQFYQWPDCVGPSLTNLTMWMVFCARFEQVLIILLGRRRLWIRRKSCLHGLGLSVRAAIQEFVSLQSVHVARVSAFEKSQYY